ncbi:glutathione peroxidase [Cryptosporidium ryanae]|uniref:glutathione peroxidase n=1 Tax=Cryptosporidium ryanae TaxID=515981 RepID=UPI00351A14C9|nr:glutathione peroxidase [Cryptosporidium ryanae]
MGNFLPQTSVSKDLSAVSVYSYTLKTLEGVPFPIEQLRGKVVLVTNVASKCGYSKPYYKQMVRMYNVFNPLGFEIIGLPSREFMGQEYSNPEDIRRFTDSYKVKFPIMEICKVNGNDALEFVQKLKRETPDLYDSAKNLLLPIKWNFSRFLLNKKGEVIAFRGTRTEPNELIPIIAKELKVANYEEIFREYDSKDGQISEETDNVCEIKGR